MRSGHDVVRSHHGSDDEPQVAKGAKAKTYDSQHRLAQTSYASACWSHNVEMQSNVEVQSNVGVLPNVWRRPVDQILPITFCESIC